MSIPLGPLYHWAPRRVREAILQEGLVVMRPRMKTDEQGIGANGDGIACSPFPWICFGTSPSSAWGLIGDPDEEERWGWDLWQVLPAEQDTLRIRGDFSPMLREIRIENSVPADRVWWVGERRKWPHDSTVEPDESSVIDSL